MGSGVSRRKSKKVELQTLAPRRNNASTVSDANNSLTSVAEQEEKTTAQDMETSSAVQNQANFKKNLTEAEKNATVLKTRLSDGDLPSEEVVSCCVELLKFSCTMDESEEIKTAAVSFVLEKNIPGLIFEIYETLLAKYPDVTKYDREKVKDSEKVVDSEQLQHAQDILNLLAGLVVNITDFPQLSAECGNVGLIPVFLEMTEALKDSIPDMIPYEDQETKIISKFTSRGRTLSRLLGALVNLAKEVSNRFFFKDSKGVEHLLPFLETKVTAYYLKSLFCLAYLIEESNNETIMADVEHVKFVIQMLDKATKSSSRAYLGFSTSDIADGISQLAVNESNSRQLGLNGILVMVNMLKSSKQDDERLAGTNALWMFSFDATNRALIKAMPLAIQTLQSLREHPNKDIVKVACGVLWEIERSRDTTSSVPTTSQHIMISYQWDSQPTVLMVTEKLRSTGFTVWIDVDNMSGSTLESMASAVENCSVFLMAISRKYLESPNCRSEAEYAYQLRKQIIPLMMEARFQPHGWLGIIMGTKLWMDFREARNVETGTSHLIRELEMREKSQGSLVTGSDQSKPKEDNLKTTLLSYKKKHRSVYVYLSESEKLIRSLRSILSSGQLATEGAFWKTDALVAVYTKIPDQPSRNLVVNFLVDVNLPEFLTEIVRTLRRSYLEAFSPGKPENNATGDVKKKRKKKASAEITDEKPSEVSSEAKWAVEVMLSISIAILNLTDLHDAFCEACGSAGLVKDCLDLLEQLKTCTPEFNDNQTLPEGPEDKDVKFSRKGSLIFELLGVLHNLPKRTNNKKYFDNSSAVETLLSFFRTQFPVYRITSLLCLAYLVDEKNNHLIMASEEPIKDILKLLEKANNSADRRSLGFSAAEIAYGLSHVATNDGNKKMIGQLGGIPLLVSMLKGPEEHEEERSAAVKALYMLSFDETNKEMIKTDDDTMALLRSLQSSANKEIQQAASGVMWEINGKKEHVHSSDSEEHVMISYQWDTQETMLRVKAELEAQGFSVWMDVEQMEGSILETMARAVERSSVLLLAVSQKYQNSPNCRSEAEYAYQRRKRMIPLMMERSYSPDGWLGIILGSKLWMDFRNEPTVGIQQLIKEISKAKAAAIQTQSVLASPPPKTTTNEKVLQWQKEDVAKWLHDIGFGVGNNEVRGKLDGPLLHMLNELRKESPEFFYNSVKTDLGLPTVIEVLQFTKELKKLLS